MINYLVSTKPSNIFFTLYVGGVLSYNIFSIYSNGSKQLIEYRKTKQIFNNEIDSIVVGIQKNWLDNLFLSLFWPIKLPFQLVPIVILNLNKPEENKSISIEKTHNNQQKIILKKEAINEIDKNEIDKNTDKFHFSDISPSFDFSLVNSR